MSQQVQGLMNESMKGLRDLVDVDCIVGEPIVTASGTTIIPISKVTFGFGSAGTDLTKSSKNDFGGRRKWLCCLAFGAMYMLAEYATFRAANMAAFGRLLPPSFGMLPAGAVISLLGLGSGSGLRRLAARHK